MRKAQFKHIFLIGFSGCGKSTIGPLVAGRLEVRFLDTDSLIERNERCTISEIFRVHGQKYFRKIEKRVIADITTRRRKRSVIALGGGAFTSPQNREHAGRSGLVIYLSCAVRELHRRLNDAPDRPLLNEKPVSGQTTREARLQRINRLLDIRLEHYRSADITFSTTDKTPQKCASEITRILKERYGYC